MLTDTTRPKEASAGRAALQKTDPPRTAPPIDAQITKRKARRIEVGSAKSTMTIAALSHPTP
jgi:hypothetical protein